MLHLVPCPSGKTEVRKKMTLFPETVRLQLEGISPFALDAFWARTNRTEGESEFVIFCKKKIGLAEEEYQLVIDATSIQIDAGGENGVIWALTTVANLLQNGQLPICNIQDAPKFGHRGVSLDCSRHFYSATEVKRIIEAMSLGKLNVLHWHLSDDQGWRIESRCFPRLHEISKDYYTQDEIREICLYAKCRGVEIVPEIDLPGHTTALLAAYPQYSCSRKKVSLATSGGIYPVILCAGREDVFLFLKTLLEEVTALFPGPRFHIGGDEAPKSEWKTCPHCSARMKALGTESYEDLQADFTQRIVDILKSLGKEAICWNETLRASNPPEDIQVQYWTLQYRDSMEAFANAGGKWIYSDMFELYLDYPHSMTSLEKIYHTKPHLGKRGVGAEEGMLGMEACLWSEHIQNNQRLEELLLPRIYAVAEICWSGAGEYKDFLARLSEQLKTSLYEGYSMTEPSWWDPKGRKRRKEAISFFTAINSGMDDEVREQTVESAAPNKEFAQSFASKFFRPSDMPSLLLAMRKQ